MSTRPLFHIHADDLGASLSVTDTILACADRRTISGVSVLAGGPDFARAIEEWKKRPGLRLAVHLNYLEGAALAPADEVPFLADERGVFKHSPSWFVLGYYLAGPKKRRLLREAIRKETVAQVAKVKKAAGDGWGLRIDSHQHVHMVPWIFREILSLKDELGITFLRFVDEPLYFPPYRNSPVAYAAGYVKYAIHRIFAAMNRRALRASGIPHTGAFVGVLASGAMGAGAVGSALAAIKNHPGEIEILFHPGGAQEDERALWDERHRGFASWYLSPSRGDEARALCDPRLARMLAAYEDGTFTPTGFAAKLSSHSAQLMKFAVTGALATATHLGFMYLFTEWLGMWYVLSSALGFLIGFGVSFFLQKFWTFAEHSRALMGKQAAKYLALQAFNLAANLALVYMLVEWGGLWYLPAQTAVLVGIAVLTFILSKYAIFAVRKQPALNAE